MEIETYRYCNFDRVKQIYLQAAGVITTMLFTAIGGVIYAGLVFGPPVAAGTPLLDDPRLGGFCLGTGWMLICWTIGSIFANLMPTVTIDPQGITISNWVFLRKHIPWDDVLSVDPVQRVFLRYSVVRARKITIFHRALGWMYGGSLAPSFLIFPEIDGYDWLIRRIRRGIAFRQ